MYWRVRKLSVDQLVRQYGVHVGLIASLVFNLFLIITRPSNNRALSKDVKANYEGFARTVTTHLLDSSYISYRVSTLALLNSELAPNVVTALTKAGMMVGSPEELAATERPLVDSGQLSAIRIDDVNMEDPTANGLIPVSVRGVVAIHSAEEKGPTKPVSFWFKYLLGNRTDPKDKNHGLLLGPDGKPLPVVAGFEDDSNKLSSMSQQSQ